MAITLFPSKISTQTMGLKPAELTSIALDSKGGDTPVLRVWGIVSGAASGTSQYGNYVKFTGEIAAINLVNGDEARSGALLVPQIAENVIKNLYDKAAKDGGAAQIAIEIGVRENTSTKGGAKYMFTMRPLIEYEGDDALSVMAESLPAPKLIKALTDRSAKVASGKPRK
jgi:hypothetical protein